MVSSERAATEPTSNNPGLRQHGILQLWYQNLGQFLRTIGQEPLPHLSEKAGRSPTPPWFSKGWECCRSMYIPITDPWDWYIYPHEWLIFMVNVGQYAIHGSFGIYIYIYCLYFSCSRCLFCSFFVRLSNVCIIPKPELRDLKLWLQKPFKTCPSRWRVPFPSFPHSVFAQDTVKSLTDMPRVIFPRIKRAFQQKWAKSLWPFWGYLEDHPS